MKKAIIIGVLALFPIIGFAQADKVGIEYLSPLVQTIIKLLQERIAVLQKEVDTCNAKLAEKSVLTPTVVVTPAPVSQVDKSGMVVEVTGPENYGRPFESTPYGKYNISVRILDRNGISLKDREVQIISPDNLYSDGIKLTIVPSGSEWYANFSYIPTQTGMKSIRLSSDRFVKEIYIEVK